MRVPRGVGGVGWGAFGVGFGVFFVLWKYNLKGRWLFIEIKMGCSVSWCGGCLEKLGGGLGVWGLLGVCFGFFFFFFGLVQLFLFFFFFPPFPKQRWVP